MKNLVYFLFLMLSWETWAQTDTTTIKIKAKIINTSSKKEISGVTVINKTKTITTVSDDHGNFEIVASLNDVLFFSHLAYEHTKVEVSSTWLQAKIKTITLLEKVNEIEPILISHLLLTGYLQIDTKHHLLK